MGIGQMIIQPGRDRCVNGLLEKSHIAVLVEALILKFPSIFQNINVNATAEDLHTGFQIYTYLSLCPLEAKASLEFYKHLVRTEDPRSIIQTSFKHLEDGFLPEKKYIQLAKSFFKEITQFFNLKLGSNVFGMSSKWKVEKMMEEEKIYVSNNTNEAEECLANEDCTKLGQMLSNQGSTESISLPVHLKKRSPSALIPYCAYATSLKKLGSALEEGDNFPVCDKFTPVLLE